MFGSTQKQIFFAFVVLWMVSVIQHSRSCEYSHKKKKKTLSKTALFAYLKGCALQTLPSNTSCMTDAYQF